MWCHGRVRVAALGVSQGNVTVGFPRRLSPLDARSSRFAVIAVFVLAVAIALGGFMHPSGTSTIRCAPRCSDSATVTRTAGASSTCIQDPGCGGGGATTTRAPVSPTVLAQPSAPVTAPVLTYHGAESPTAAIDRIATSGLFRPPR
jgi:hypothetical protein